MLLIGYASFKACAVRDQMDGCSMPIDTDMRMLKRSVAVFR